MSFEHYLGLAVFVLFLLVVAFLWDARRIIAMGLVSAVAAFFGLLVGTAAGLVVRFFRRIVKPGWSRLADALNAWLEQLHKRSVTARNASPAGQAGSSQKGADRG